MKQLVYTCLRCGKQETMRADRDELPVEWAVIHYERVHVLQPDDEARLVEESMELNTAGRATSETFARTTSETHACGDCAKVVLDFLEPPQTTSHLESA